MTTPYQTFTNIAWQTLLGFAVVGSGIATAALMDQPLNHVIEHPSFWEISAFVSATAGSITACGWSLKRLSTYGLKRDSFDPKSAIETQPNSKYIVVWSEIDRTNF
jgi:hypothetical protein